MADSPVDNESTDAGLGISLGVTLIPVLDPNTVKGEVAAKVGDQLVNYVNSVQAQAKEIGRIFEKIAAVGNLKENRSPERVTNYKAFSDSLDVFSKVVDRGFSDVKSPRDAVAATGLTSVLVNNVAQLTSSLAGLRTTVTPISNKAELKAVNTLGSELNTAIAGYNKAVKLVAKETGARAKEAPAVELVNSLVPRSTDKELTSLELQALDARRQEAVRAKRLAREQVKTQRAMAYRPATGMAFDLETAYRAEGPIGDDRKAKGLPMDNVWSLGMKRLDPAAPAVGVTRNLEKDNIPLEEFNKQFVKDAPTKNLKSSRGLLTAFLTEYAKSGGSMGLNAPNLPLLVGQNTANDLQSLEEMARNLVNLPETKPGDARLSKRFLDISNRLLRGDQQHMLKDTITEFEDFIQGTGARGGLGYTGYKVSKHGGAKLENIAAALQKSYTAHGAVSDAEMTADVFQTLTEPESRKRLMSKTPGMSEFSFSRWRDSFERTKTVELLRKQVGPDNEAIVQDYIAGKPLIPAYQSAAKSADIEAAMRTEEVFRPETLGNPANFTPGITRKTADPSSVVAVHSVASEAIKQAFISQIFSEKDELTSDNFRSRVDNLIGSSLIQDNIRKVIDTYGIDGEVRKAAHVGLEKQLRGVAELTKGSGFEKTRNFSTAETELAERLIEDQYGKGAANKVSPDRVDTSVKFDASAKQIFSSLLQPALENNAKDFADLTTLNAKAKFWKPEEFRTSFVASHFKEKDGINLETLRQLATTGAWLPDTINASAAERGNQFEQKMFTDIKKNFADKYRLTHTAVDVEGQAELSLTNQKTGRKIIGHPDGFGVDLQTGQPFIAEAKYANAEAINRMSKTGTVPRQWDAQTNLYSMMAGMPVGTPVKYFVGNLDRATPELTAIDDELKNAKNLSAKGKLQLEEQKQQLIADLQKRPLSDYDLGDVTVLEHRTSATVQKQLNTLLTNIFDTPANSLVRSKLPKEVQEVLVKELNLDPAGNITTQLREVLNSTTGDARVRNLRSSIGVEQRVAEGTIAISDGGGGSGKKPPTGGGGGGGEPPDDGDDYNRAKQFAEKGGKDFFDANELILPKPPTDLDKQLGLVDKAYVKAEAKYLLAESRRTGLINLGRAYTGEDGKYKMPPKVEEVYEGQRSKVEYDLISSYNEMQALRQQQGSLTKRISLREEPNLADPEFIKATALTQALDEYQQQQVAAKQAAFKAAVDIEKKGLSTATLLPATAAAKELQALGLEGTAGYTRQELLMGASKARVSFTDMTLPSVTADLTKQSSTQVLRGEQNSIKSTMTLATEANKAVNKLFDQLYTVGGQTFISPAVKEFQNFINKSQEAVTKAEHFKQKAAIAGEQVTFLSTKGDTEGASYAQRVQQRSEAVQQRYLEKAREYAREADKHAKALPASGVIKTYSSPEERQVLETEFKNAELVKLESLYQKKAELETQSSMPSFAPSGKHYQSIADIEREITNITKGYEAEKFDITLTTKIATTDAQANLNEFILNANKQAIHLKAKVDAEGLTTESLHGILSNNMTLASKGMVSPGYSTSQILSKAIAENVEIVPRLKPNTEAYTSIAASKFNQKSTFNDLLRDNKLVDSAVNELYSTLATDLPNDNFLTAATRKFKQLHIDATLAIDKVKQLTAAERIAREEAAKTTDKTEKAKLEKEAANFERAALVAAADAKAQIVNLEAKASTAKHNVYSKTATSKLQVDLREELALEKELLLIEQQRLSTLLKMGIGSATQKPVAGAITTESAQKLINVNTRLGTLGVQPTPGALTNNQVFTVAAQGGITEEQITGKAGRNVDFLGSTVDLIEWQMQWLSGVAVLGAVSAAFRNTFLFAIQFEAVLKNIQLITQANNVEMKTLYGSLEELTRTFQFSVSELGEGLIILGQAGFTAMESLTILPGITALATATMSNLKIAADVTTTALEAFQLPVSDTESLVNALAAMTIESKLDIEKLGTTFNYVAASAASAGLSIEETGTAMGLMSNAGVRASTIGTSLRSILGVLTEPTAKFRAALSKVGLTVDDVNPATNRLSDVFLKLKNSGFDVESAFAGLDKRIAGGVITLIHSADQWEDFQGKITNTNRAFDMAEGQMDTLQAQTKRLANTFQLFGKSWFGGNLDELKGATKMLTNFVAAGTRGAELMPEQAKAGINAIIGTTSALSVVTSVWTSWRKEKEAVGNLRDVNAKAGLPLDTGISARSRKIQSTAEFIFNPNMIGYAALITGAIMGTSAAVGILSGEYAKIEANTVADTFSAHTTALTETVKAYNNAALGTREFAKAQEQLLKLGVKDFSKENLEYIQSVSRINTGAAQEQAARASGTEYTSGTTEFLRYLKPKEDEALFDTAAANDFESAVRRRGIFYSGSQSEIMDYATELGFMKPTDILPNKAVQTVLDLSSQAKASEGYESALTGEIHARFKALSRDRGNFDRAEQATKDLLADLEKFYAAAPEHYEGGAEGYYAEWQNILGRVKSEFPTMDTSKVSKRSGFTELLQTRLNVLARDKAELNDDDSALNKLYEDLVIQADPTLAYSGSQRQASEKFSLALKELNAALAEQAKIMNLPEGRNRTNLLDAATKRVTAAKKKATQSNKRLALLTGMEGSSPATMHLIEQYLELLTDRTKDNLLEVSKDGLAQFKALPALATTALGDELEKLTVDYRNELNLLPKEMQESDDVKLALRVKYDLKLDELVQSSIDKVFEPVVALIEKKEVIDSMLRDLAKENESLSGDIRLDAIQGEASVNETQRPFTPGIFDGTLKDVAGSADNNLEKGYLNLTSDKYWDTGTSVGSLRPRQGLSDIRPEPYYIPAYTQDTAARDKISTARKVLQQKELNDENQLRLKREALAAEHAVKMKAIGDTGLQANVDKRNQEIAKYYTALRGLEMDYRKTQLSTIKEVEGLRSQQLERLTTAEQARFDSVNSLRRVVQQGYEATNHPDAESNQETDELLRRAKKEFGKAKTAVQAGEFGTAKAAQSEAERLLSLIVSDSDRSVEDKEKATKEASDRITDFDLTYETQVNAYKTALTETNTLLTQMRDSLARYASPDGNATVTTANGKTVEKQSGSSTVVTEDGRVIEKKQGSGTAQVMRKDGSVDTYTLDADKGWSGHKTTKDGELEPLDVPKYNSDVTGIDLKALSGDLDVTRKDLEQRITDMSSLTIQLESVVPAMVTVLDEKLGSIVNALSENMTAITNSLTKDKEDAKEAGEAKQADSEEKIMKIETSFKVELAPTELFTSTIVNSQQMTTKMKNVIIEDLNNIPA